MSNLSLKEQLEALSLNSASSPVSEDRKNKKLEQKPTSSVKKKPSWLEYAQYGVELLKVYFPACFKEIGEIKPLKVGIKQDLVKYLSSMNDIVMSDKACMVSSLAYYVNSFVYLKSVLEGEVRIDLNGAPAGIVTAEEAKYSIESRQAKLQKKAKQKTT